MNKTILQRTEQRRLGAIAAAAIIGLSALATPAAAASNAVADASTAQAPVVQARYDRDNVIRFGNDDFNFRLRLGDGRDNHHYGRHHGRHDRHARLSPRQVRRILHRRGYDDIARPRYHPRRNVYVVRAENHRNRDVRLTVNARNGRIVDVDRIGRW